MKMVKSLLLGCAAGLVAFTGAQAADLSVKAKAVQYVKVVSLNFSGNYYGTPGVNYQAAKYTYVDARAEMGTLDNKVVANGIAAMKISATFGQSVSPARLDHAMSYIYVGPRTGLAANDIQGTVNGAMLQVSAMNYGGTLYPPSVAGSTTKVTLANNTKLPARAADSTNPVINTATG
ncbi:hypothetical protein K8R03_02285 [Candidatus Kaiserbacteria bacterium]|nr:hypothetical protein [Candidatus Kaiserbacteria bacterium]